MNATISATISPIASSSTVVSTSSALSIFSDWYGRVKKKSNDIAATTAASAPLHACADRGPEHDDEHEDQHHVGAGEIVAERHEDPGHEERAEGGDGEPDRPGHVVGERGCVVP